MPENFKPSDNTSAYHVKTILFVFRRKRKERIVLYHSGRGPDEMLYGLCQLDNERYRTDYIEDDERFKWRRLPFRLVEKKITKWSRIGFAIFPLSFSNIHRLRQADVIVSTVDSCGLPIAMLKYFKLLKTPVIYNSQGLSDRMAKLSSSSFIDRLFMKSYCRFLNSIEYFMVLGKGAVNPTAEILNLPIDKITCVPFGVDTRFWRPGVIDETGDYILSVGSDLARDYKTLIAALTGERLKIVTRLSVDSEKANGDIEVSSDYTHLELRNLYRAAKFVITPLKDVSQPSGQSATLQAMACGKAVILTKTKGLWEPEQMIHLENCYLVKPNSVEELRKGINYLSQHPEEADKIGKRARQLVEERYCSKVFAEKIQNLVDKAIS